MWTVALFAVCLLAATRGASEGADVSATVLGSPAAVGALSATADPAVLPAGVADEVRGVPPSAPLRVLVPAAVIAVLLGLPAALRRRSSTGGRVPRPLWARRHAITLRAPPLTFA